MRKKTLLLSTQTWMSRESISRMAIRILCAGLTLLLVSSCGLAQRKPSKEKEQTSGPIIKFPDEEQINQSISEMLAAWQMGDLELLHRFYADDVTVVSGVWEPPLHGWASYAAAYQRQRERMQGGSIDRQSTYVNVKGNWAWAAYQWEFRAVVDGKPTTAHGHTTLVFEKRKERWLIVHNHTSIVPEAPPQLVPAPGEPKPTPPAAQSAPRQSERGSRPR